MKNRSNEIGARQRPGWGALCAGAALLGMALWSRRAVRSRNAARAALASKQALHAQLLLRVRSLDHDLRSPVGAMAVALELLRTADDARTHAEAADVLERQIARMTTLTERVHELAQGLAD
ncbi:histidine kinase dimerization/phospho-acceptor domain-containing protein [Variovorax sp. Root411]|uniref:histidine kinase dimerization/phospho-acceptor domain-containing protein n=1 Tax=Variovorax sp. Root411 TaxID=1736530 RepID=UPI0006F595C5|nr:histidine kinase dimerization/phospho-acceptor domain-containing protein [Variovorax sp. Root411]KQW54337.1 hypothetical protein ASC92_20095 [Variovorax sp. Root411]